MRRRRIIGIVVMIWGTSASRALACGTCVAAGLDLIMPPILFWSALSLTWFFSMAILSSVTKHRFRGQPSILWAIGIGALALLLGGSFLGPIAVLPLALPPLYAAALALRSRSQEPVLERVRKGVLVIAAVHVVAAGLGIGLLVHTLSTRSEAAYICEWSGTAPGRARFQQLREQEPGSVESYRYIVQYGSGWVVADAAERLGAVGDPDRDSEILRRARIAAAEDSHVTTAIDAALKTLDERRRPGA